MRVLFVDVDGPLIPSGMYLVHPTPSYERVFSPIAVAVLKKMIESSKAKIVMNTTHNLDGQKLKDDLLKVGFKEEDFGLPWKTDYPVSHGRTGSIEEWLKNQSEKNIEWVALDDEDFTSSDKLILIDFDEGLHLRHYNKLSKLWNFKPIRII